jgi:hypothetical protein
MSFRAAQPNMATIRAILFVVTSVSIGGCATTSTGPVAAGPDTFVVIVDRSLGRSGSSMCRNEEDLEADFNHRKSGALHPGKLPEGDSRLFLLVATARGSAYNKRRVSMQLPRLLLTLAPVLMLPACATPMQQTDAAMQAYDRDTEYAVTQRPNGFAVSINYSRYQFIPESGAVATACKSQVMAIAYEHADKSGRKIQPLNEQVIRISLGRNGLTGVTSCSAMAIAEWSQ